MDNIKSKLENCSTENLKYLAAACYMSPRAADISVYAATTDILEERLNNSYEFTDFLSQLGDIAEIRRQCTPRKKEF